MRAVVQRVSEADVTVGNDVTGKINSGLMVLIGVEETDTKEDAGYLAEKVVNLRVFEDNDGKMNLSLMDIKGEMLAVSQFTLMGDCRKGRRPSFTQAANPEKAIELYNCFIEKCKQIGIKVETGVFQAEMKVRLCNEGPVTLIIDSNKLF